jgi:dolichyl-diphosphooligosaccharide---protein glycosyltransferase
VFLSSLAIMAASAPLDPLLRGKTSKNTRGLLRVTILLTIAAAAVSARLFSVIRMFNATAFAAHSIQQIFS